MLAHPAASIHPVVDGIDQDIGRGLTAGDQTVGPANDSTDRWRAQETDITVIVRFRDPYTAGQEDAGREGHCGRSCRVQTIAASRSSRRRPGT
jgi:hypothetical protein